MQLHPLSISQSNNHCPLVSSPIRIVECTNSKKKKTSLLGKAFNAYHYRGLNRNNPDRYREFCRGLSQRISHRDLIGVYKLQKVTLSNVDAGETAPTPVTTVLSLQNLMDANKFLVLFNVI